MNEPQQIFNHMVENKLTEYKNINGDEFVWYFDGDNKLLSRYHNREHFLFPNMIKPTKIIYLSGPISDIPFLNVKLFEKYEIELTKKNYYVFNPHKISSHIPIKSQWNIFMKNDISYLLKSDIVLCLPGWETSKGALIEIFLAQQLKIKVIDIEFEEITKHGQLKFV